MASLTDQVIAGLPSPNDLADQFGYRGAPSAQGPVGALTPDNPNIWGAASVLQNINNARGTPITQDAARQQIATNTNAAKATLYPTSKGAQALTQYVQSAYPNGNVPPRIQEALKAASQGGMNDFGISAVVDSDKQQRKAAGTYDYGNRIGGLGGGAMYESIRPSTYLEDVLMAPAELARAQNAAALGPTGPGLFGPLLSIVNPAAGALFSTGYGAMTQNPIMAGSGILTTAALGGAFDGIADSIKSAFSGGGFVNPQALDIYGTGTGANALGLTNPEQWSGLSGLGGAFINPSALATPTQINDAINYTPVSLGGQAPTTSIKPALDAAKQLIPLAAEPEQPQAPGLLGGVGGGAGGAIPGYNPLRAPAPPDPLRYFRLETRAR